MSITDFASLKTAIGVRAIRTDLSAYYGDFVRSAHDEIVNKLVLCATVSLSAATASLPTDFRLAVAVILDTSPATPLEQGDSSQVANLGSGVPRYFYASAGTLNVAPTPDITYPAKVFYKMSRTAFSGDADYNTALTRYPFLYLDGAMAELFAHARNAEEEAKYRQKFEAGLEQANMAELEDFYGAGALQPMPGVVV